MSVRIHTFFMKNNKIPIVRTTVDDIFIDDYVGIGTDIFKFNFSSGIKYIHTDKEVTEKLKWNEEVEDFYDI